jgi:methionine-rich copper-binding protein CopC
VQVGGSHGFGTELTALDADDNFTGIDVAAAFANGLKLGATTYSALNQVFVGVNGYLTFGAGNSSYSAAGIAGYTTSPMIAAQFDDIYGGKAIAQSPGGTSTGSNHIYYNVDAAAHIVTVTWDDVAPFTNGSVAGSDYSHGNAYQIRLHWLQDSDFLIEMRYESMSWIGGNGGLPTAGWTAGDGKTYGEVQGSGTSAMLNLAGTSNFGHAGVYLWEVKNGVVTEHLIDINDARGKVVFNLNASDGAGSAGLNYTLADGADSRFSIVNGNQIAVKADAQFDLAHESSVTLPLVVTDAAGNVLQQNVVMTLFASPDVTAPTLASASPADGASAGATDAALVLTFSEAVQAGSGVIKLVQDGSEGVSIDIAVNSSAVVFNGGTVTITPPAGLLHDASYHVEIASGVIQDAAHNAYAGISNATTLNFHTAADTQAPTLASASPADDATAVATNASLVLTFNEAVQAGSGAIKLVQDGGSSVDIAVTSSEVVFNGKTVTITPTAGLQAGTHYHIEMASGVIEDTAHNAYAGISDATTLNFSTAADTLAPTLTSSSPADGATDVAVGSALVLTFNENVQAGTGVIKLVQDGGSGNAVDIAVNSSAVVFSGHTVTIDPIGDLVAGASYHLEMAGGVIEDLAHNAYAGISDATTLNFNTAGGDTTAPHLVSSEPADDDTYVYRRDPVVLTFDEGVKAGSGNIEFYYDSGEGVYLEASVAVTDTSQVSFNGSTMTITLTNGFDAVEGHPHPISVQLASGVVVDLVGNPYAGISDHTTLNFVVNEPT